MKIRIVHTEDAISESNQGTNAGNAEKEVTMRCDAFSLEAHLRQISRSMEESMRQINQHKNPKDTDFIRIDEVLELNGAKRLKAK